MDLGWIETASGLIVTMLAAFRITRSIVADAFPLGVARARFVAWANERWPAGLAVARQNETVREASGFEFPRGVTAGEQREFDAYEGMAPLAYLATCYWCTGLYVSVACALLASTGTWWMWAATPLAISAVVGLLGTRD